MKMKEFWYLLCLLVYCQRVILFIKCWIKVDVSCKILSLCLLKIYYYILKNRFVNCFARWNLNLQNFISIVFVLFWFITNIFLLLWRKFYKGKVYKGKFFGAFLKFCGVFCFWLSSVKPLVLFSTKEGEKNLFSRRNNSIKFQVDSQNLTNWRMYMW